MKLSHIAELTDEDKQKLERMIRQCPDCGSTYLAVGRSQCCKYCALVRQRKYNREWMRNNYRLYSK